MEKATTLVERSTWKLDKAHAKLHFTVTHLMGSEGEEIQITANAEFEKQ